MSLFFLTHHRLKPIKAALFVGGGNYERAVYSKVNYKFNAH